MTNYYSKKEYQSIANLYDLGKINNISRLHVGYGGSAKIKATTEKGEFVISKDILSSKKAGLNKSLESLQYEIDMLSTVKGMPVPYFIESKNKKYIEGVGSGWVTVYPFLPGSSPKTINSKKAKALGLFLGEFHYRSKKFKREIPSRRRFYDLNEGVMKKMRPFAYNQKNKTLKALVSYVENGVSENRPPSILPVGPIHVDIGHNNELFTGNKLSGIIDFGNFYRDSFMIDVGKTIMWNCCLKGNLNNNLLSNFMDGYTSKRPLTKEESKYLKKSILYAIYSHIWVDLYHVPLKYVPESWPLYLAKTFLPVAKKLEKSDL